MTVRWLDHVPMGGASGIVSIRRAARAVQNGDAEIVACIAGDTNHTDSFRRNTSAFSQFSQDAVYPYGSGGPNASFAFLTAYYMRTYGATREDFGKLCVAQRTNAMKNPLALLKKPLTLEHYLDARLVADPLRLFGARPQRTWACGTYGSLAQSSGITRLPTIRCNIAAAGSWTATIYTHRQALGLRTSTSSKPTTTIR
jgi:acetyl-CoA acetyltransferase